MCGPLPVAVANEGLAWNNPGCHYYWKEAAPANVYICVYMVVHENISPNRCSYFLSFEAQQNQGLVGTVPGKIAAARKKGRMVEPKLVEK